MSILYVHGKDGKLVERMTILPRCKSDRDFVLLQDLVIPAGTTLTPAPKERGGRGYVEATVAMGKDATAYLNMPVDAIEDAPSDLIAEAE